MKENLVRANLVITKKLRAQFDKEAINKCGGNLSLLMKLILAKRYEMPKEIEDKFKPLLEEV